jgi:hypothetical protein
MLKSDVFGDVIREELKQLPEMSIDEWNHEYDQIVMELN